MLAPRTVPTPMARSLTAERDACNRLFVNQRTASLDLSESLAPGETNLPVVAVWPPPRLKGFGETAWVTSPSEVCAAKQIWSESSN